MPQEAKTSFFTFDELMNIILGLILLSQPEFLLFYRKTAKNNTSVVFYIDNSFGAFKIYQEQYIFLRDHFFPYIVWSKLKLVFFKFKIRMTKIFILGEEYKISKKVQLKPDKIEKILSWSISQDQIAIRVFFDTIQFIHH